MERRRREGSHEMIPRREPRQQKSTKRTGHKVVFILGTVLLVGICTVAMLAGLFMMYVRTTLAPTLEVNADDYTMNAQLHHLLPGQGHRRLGGIPDRLRHGKPHLGGL